jgi:hypothetical protein
VKVPTFDMTPHMNKSRFLLIGFLISFLAQATDSPTPVPYQWGVYRPSKDTAKIVMVDWNSKEGLKRLERSQFKGDFYRLAHFYQTAANPVYATIASAVTVLNGLRVPKHLVKSQAELEIQRPKALGGDRVPYPFYSQEIFLNEKTDEIKDRKLILIRNITPENENDKESFKPGLGLDDLKAMLEKVYSAKAEVTYGNEDAKIGTAKLRKTLKRVFNDPNSFLIANFRGDIYGANNEGTMSPLVAYDEKSDSVLVLDTGAFKNPWYWVPVEAFYKSMVPYGKTQRGYIEVRD